MNRKKRPFCRMQENSTFGAILEAAVRSMPGCVAAAFVDQEGEAVDAVGWADEFDIKVAGAHLRIVLELARTPSAGPVVELLITATRLSYRIRTLPEGYALVMMFDRDAAFIATPRQMDVCVHALAREAGFSLDRKLAWFSVEVVTQSARNLKPRRAKGEQGGWFEVEVLGAIVGLTNRERGYRVRLANGHEVTLLREPLGRWWSDAPLE